MSETDVLLQSVEWLVDHNQEIPEDILQELKEIGIPVNQAKYANYLIEGMKTEVEAMKTSITNQGKTEPTIVNVDFNEISIKLSELVELLKQPKKEVKIPEIKIPDQKPPTINVIMPKVKKSTQSFKRGQTGEIVSSETFYEYTE